MPSFLRGLFETKAAANDKNAVTRAVSNTRGYTGAIPGSQSWDIDQAMIQGYERVIWVYRCIDAIASNASGIPMVVREYDDHDGKIVDDVDLMRLLNRRPNIYETSQQFRYRLASQLLLSRRGVFVEVVRSRGGRPSELHILPPGTTTPIPDPKTYVSGYQVQTVQQGIVELNPDQVIWIRAKPHPTDLYGQMTPLVAAGLAADTDFLARLYNRNFLVNDGRPGMLVAVQGQLAMEDAEEIRRRFSGGPSAAGQTTVIEAEGISATDMTGNPRDVQWQEAVRGSKEDILLAFGVPESVLGNASGRTFDNADAEFEIFWTVTMLPFMDAIGAGFDILTNGGLEDNLFVAHDYSQVDVLQRQKRARHDKAMSEFKAGTMTIDQYLEAVGREPMNVPGTEVLWLPPGMVPVGKDDAVTQAAAGLMPVGQGGQGGAPPNPAAAAQQGAMAGAEQGALQGIQKFQRASQNENAARALRLAGKQGGPFDEAVLETKDVNVQVGQLVSQSDDVHPYEIDRIAAEAEIQAHVSAWSRRQQRAIIERLGGVKARKHTRHWGGQPGTKALDAMYVVNPEQWADDLVENMVPVIEAMAEKEALKAARELNRAGVVDKILADGQGNPSGRTPLDRLLGKDESRVFTYNDPTQGVEEWIRESALRQSQKVAEKIAEMDEAGASLEEIQKAVEDMVGSRSSWQRGLAIAATTSAMEGARNEVYKRGGKYVQRVWKTVRDERVRPAHRKAHGQVRGAAKPFSVGGFPMMYPGDPSAPIHLTANCRCWVEPRVAGETVSVDAPKPEGTTRTVRRVRMSGASPKKRSSTSTIRSRVNRIRSQ